MNPLPPDIELRYQARHPWRTLAALLQAPWHIHGRIVLYYLIKNSPGLLFPIFTAEVIRMAGHPESVSPGHFLWTCLIFLICILQNPLSHYYFLLLTSGRVRSIEQRLRGAVARQLQSLTMAYHAGSEPGRLQAKILRDVEDITQLIHQIYNVILDVAISLIWVMGVAFLYDPVVGLFFVLTTPLMAGVVWLFRQQMGQRNRHYREGVEALNAGVAEMIDMIPVTRAHGLEDRALSTIHQRLAQVYRRGLQLDIINGFFSSASWVSMRLSHFALLAFTGWLALSGRFTVDKIVLYNGLFFMVLMSLFGILNVFPLLTRGLDAIRSLGDVLESTDLERNEGRAVVHQVRGAVEFRHVTFHYAEKQAAAVHDFSLRVEPGQCVALVGESGAGKSTVMNLLLGFWRPREGQILLDGQEMSTLDMRTYRRFVAVVPQHTILFSGTLRENITYGLEQVPENRLQEVIRAAQLHDFIKSLANGLETPVGKNGLKLSGGQRQRVAIARALIRDPRLIIMDEATSALDVISEKEVQSAIETMVQGRTTFIVAHRLSTIRMADWIVVMKAGRAVEQGTHEDLARPGTEFYRLKSLQV